MTQDELVGTIIMIVILSIVCSVIGLAIYHIFKINKDLKQINLDLVEIDKQLKILDAYGELLYKWKSEINKITEYQKKTQEVWDTLDMYIELNMAKEANEYLKEISIRSDTTRKMLDDYTEKRDREDKEFKESNNLSTTKTMREQFT